MGAGTSRANHTVLVGPYHVELAWVLEGQRGTLFRESRGLAAAGVIMGAWEEGGGASPEGVPWFPASRDRHSSREAAAKGRSASGAGSLPCKAWTHLHLEVGDWDW